MIICSKCDKIVIVCHKIMQNTMRQQRKQHYHVFMKTWFGGRNDCQNRKFSVFVWFIPTVVRAITRFEKKIISISRCCGPQKIEKILTNHKKMKNVNTKCDFRQFRLDSKSYNFCILWGFRVFDWSKMPNSKQFSKKWKFTVFPSFLWRFSGEDSLKTHFENINLEAWLRQETLFWNFKKYENTFYH